MSRNYNKINFVLSTGWALRNYLYSGVISELSKHIHINIYAPTAYAAAILSYSKGANSIQYIEYNCGNEPILWKVFRQARKRIYQSSRGSTTEDLWHSYGNRTLGKRIGALAVAALVYTFGHKKVLYVFEKIDFKINKSKLNNNLKFDANDIFVGTYASNYYDETLFREAKRINLTTVLMILSWDHLSSKIIVPSFYNHILCWNDVSKYELISTYKSYNDKTVHVVGAPHFDCYDNEPGIAKEEFCKIHGIQKDSKIILYSTMPQIRHNGQHHVINHILKNITSKNYGYDRVHLIIKVHPFDDNSVYDMFSDYDFITIIKSTRGVDVEQTDWVPVINETELNRDLLYFCDLNINIFSTMTLEGIFLNKPIINIAYDYPGQCNPIPCRMYYEFDHFKPIANSGATKICYCEDDLDLNIRRYLKNPDLDSDSRIRVSNIYKGSKFETSFNQITRFFIGLLESTES